MDEPPKVNDILLCKIALMAIFSSFSLGLDLVFFSRLSFLWMTHKMIKKYQIETQRKRGLVCGDIS